MESNSDKLMREKLQGFNAPFDPEAWSNMEQMLDQKKKRRAIIWWWTGGSVAAVLLMGWLLSSLQPAKQAEQVAVAQTQTQNIEQKEIITSVNEKATEKSKNIKSFPSENNLSQMHNPSHKTKRAKQNPVVKHLPEEQQSFVTAAEPSSAVNAAVEVNEEFRARVAEAEMLQQIRAKAEAEALIEQASEEQITEEEKKKEEPLASTEPGETTPEKKMKKPSVFSYRLGAVANVSGTTVGKQNFDGKKEFFDTIPAFSVGIQQEFLFWNRVSLYTGLMYTQTEYRVARPAVSETLAAGNVYESYRSNMQQIDIPIGVKVYPYVSEKFRLFVHAGVINHIKLREQFTSQITSPNAVLTTPDLIEVTNYTTNSNPFGSAVSADITAGFSQDPNTEADFFGINKQKRYYASFYSSIGAAFVFKKRCELVVEPMYSFSLHKIGEQNKRKHQLGVSIGFNYAFGKL